MKKLEETKNFITSEVNFMIINSIVVGGYKNVSKVKLDFTGITALVAPNGFGKSNVLDAIKFGFNYIAASQNEKALMMKNPLSQPKNKRIILQNYAIELVMSSQTNERPCTIKYSFEFSWQNKDEGGKIVSENLDIKHTDNKNNKFTKYVTRTSGATLYRTSVTGRCDTNLKIKDNELAINRLALYDILFYQEVLQAINEMSFYTERRADVNINFIPSLTKDDNYPIDSLNINNMDDVPRYIHFLKINQPKKYELLIQSFKSLFPNISEVDVLEIDMEDFIKQTDKIELPSSIKNSAIFELEKMYHLIVTDKNIEGFNLFPTLSSGTKKIFVFLAVAISAEINNISIIALEELENSLHPALMQRLISILEQFAGNTRILLTSHSPYLIDCIKPKEMYLPVPNDDGTAEFNNISSGREAKKVVNDAAKYNQGLGDYIFTLLSGDEDDFDILKSYLGVSE